MLAKYCYFTMGRILRRGANPQGVCLPIPFCPDKYFCLFRVLHRLARLSSVNLRGIFVFVCFIFTPFSIQELSPGTETA